jgi:hypothetical protein
MLVRWFRRQPTLPRADPVDFQQAALEREKHLASQRDVLVQEIRVIVQDEQAKLRVRLDALKVSLSAELRELTVRFVKRTGVLKVPLRLTDFVNEQAAPLVQRSFGTLLDESLGGFRQRIQSTVSATVHVRTHGEPFVESADGAVALEYAKITAPLVAGVATAVAMPFAAVTTTLLVFTSVSWPMMLGLGALAALLATIAGKGASGLENRLVAAIHERMWPPIAEALDGKGWKDPHSKKQFRSVEVQLLAAFKDGGDQAIAKTRLASKRLEIAFRRRRKELEVELRAGRKSGSVAELVDDAFRQAVRDATEVA